MVRGDGFEPTLLEPQSNVLTKLDYPLMLADWTRFELANVSINVLAGHRFKPNSATNPTVAYPTQGCQDPFLDFVLRTNFLESSKVCSPYSTYR